MIFKQETVNSWFNGINSSINDRVIRPFANAEQIIWKYNQAIEHNSLSQQGWERILAQSDSGLRTYLANIKGTNASMAAYTMSLQGNVTGFRKVSTAIQQFNTMSSSGIKEQSSFASAIGITNGALGAYLLGLNGAKASLGGYIMSLIGVTLKTVALRVATIALNTALTMGASLIVSGVVTAISSWINKSETMKAAAEKTKQEITALNNELKDNRKLVSDSGQRYAELAQGVDQLTGKNISLNDDEYREFLNLSNELAEVFPTLSRNYTENGDAIVQLSGDIDTIVGSLNNLVEAQADIVNRQNAEALSDLFKNTAEDSKKYVENINNLENDVDAINKSLSYISDDDITANLSNGLSEKWIHIENDNYEYLSELNNDLLNLLKDNNLESIELKADTSINEYGIEIPIGYTISILSSDEEIKEAEASLQKGIDALKKKYSGKIDELTSEIEAENKKIQSNWSSLSSIIASWLKTDTLYSSLSESMQASLQQVIYNIDWSSLDFSTWDDAQKYIRENIFTLFQGKNGERISNALDFKVQLDNGLINIDEYLEAISNLKIHLSNLDDQTKKTIDLIFNVTSSDGSDIKTMVNNVQKKLKNEFDYKVGELSLGDLEIAFNKISVAKGTKLSWDDLLTKIQDYKNQLNDDRRDKNVFTSSTFANVIEQLHTIDELYSNFHNKLDNNKPLIFDAVDLQGLDSSFKDLPSFEEFNKLFTNGTGTEETLQKAFNSLVTEWLFATKALTGLNTQTRDQIIAQLELNGLSNAGNLITINMARAFEEAAYYGYDLSDATTEEIIRLSQMASISNEAKKNIALLGLAKLNTSNIALKTSADIQNIAGLVATCGGGVTALNALATAKEGFESGNTSDFLTFEEMQALSMPLMADPSVYKSAKEKEQKRKETLSAAQKEINDVLSNLGNTDYNGINNFVNSGATGSGKVQSEQEINWSDRKLKLLSDKDSNLEKKSSSSFLSYLGLTESELNRAKEILSQTVSPAGSDLQELSEIAANAGMSMSQFYKAIEDGGTESRRSSLLSQLELEKTLLSEYDKLLPDYQKKYEDAVAKLPDDIKNKIENGGDDIELFPGDQGEEILKVIDYYDKWQSKLKDQEDLQKKHIGTTKSYYENDIAYANAETEKLKNNNSLIEAQISYLKESGSLVDAASYEILISNLRRQENLINRKIKDKEAELNALLSSGEIKEGTEEYYNIENEISSLHEELIGTKEEQKKLNNELLRMPIDNLDTIINMYNDITSAIENWGSVYEASGKKLDTSYYQTLITNGATIIDHHKKQADAVQNLMGRYKEGSETWNELYSKLQSINSEMSSMVQNLHQWNEALLQMPLDSIKEYSSTLQQALDGMTDLQSDYDAVLSAVTGAIQEQIDALQEENELTNDTYQNQIDALQEQLDLLDKANEARQYQLSVEQALYELEKARNQKTTRVIRGGQTTYESDSEAVRNAENSLADAQYELEKYNLQTKMDGLQEELDGINEAYDSQVEKLEKISQKWSEIKDNIETAKNEALAADYLGAGWKNTILNGDDTELYNLFKGLNESLSQQMTNYEEQINTTENISSLLENYITSYKEGTLSYDQAMTGINDLLSQINEKMSAEDNLQNIYDYLGAVGGTSADAESILAAVQQSLSQTADELLKSMAQYNENSGMISEYTSSWQQLTDNVANMKDILEDVRENLADALEGRDDDDDDDENRSKKRGHSYKGDDKSSEVGPGVSLAEGIKHGLVGSNSATSREAVLKLLGLKKLNNDEVKAILHKGEAVYNPLQQKMLLDNFAFAYNCIPDLDIPSLDYSSLTTIKKDQPMQQFNFGDIQIQKCDNPDGFAKALGSELRSSLRIDLGRR
ncbi:hypothetical protein GPL15_20375 [Clostridium sp. MCC353]|uniref:hypothetical protein n=1 Tax=Clostridium sp. MCC353 TaxID=2592646 RepID=UPI001C03448B|nr:hypothetical protein [Clostridium sp. MCC353]MBT9778839.1 hypothetical protein [Clostridium sp. MCC353]